MIEYLRAPVYHQRDWHNYDYLDRPTGLSWPWPTPSQQTLQVRATRLMAWIAGLVASLPPDWQSKRATSRP